MVRYRPTREYLPESRHVACGLSLLACPQARYTCSRREGDEPTSARGGPSSVDHSLNGEAIDVCRAHVPQAVMKRSTPSETRRVMEWSKRDWPYICSAKARHPTVLHSTCCFYRIPTLFCAYLPTYSTSLDIKRIANRRPTLNLTSQAWPPASPKPKTVLYVL